MDSAGRLAVIDATARGGAGAATAHPGTPGAGTGLDAGTVAGGVPPTSRESAARSRRSGGPRQGWRRLTAPGFVLSALILLVIVGWSLAPGLFASADPITGVPAEKLTAPGAAHWFGTDHLGRDIYARTVHGAALSLKAALIAIAIALGAGSALGLVAGFVGGRLDDLLMRAVDVLLAIPDLLLSLAVITALGFGTGKVAIAVGIASVPKFARVMRSEVLRTRHATYVEAGVLAGTRRTGIVLRHVLPNSAGPVLVLAVVEFGVVILAVSALSFLGYGAPPPAPEWGSLVSEGRNYLAVAWWYTTLPGLVIAAFVLAVNRIGWALDRGEGRTS